MATATPCFAEPFAGLIVLSIDIGGDTNANRCKAPDSHR